MSTITLEAIDARQTELAEMIAAFKNSGRTIAVAAKSIELRPGEHYAGLALNEDGTPSHHLILLAASPNKHLAWQAAMEWAVTAGGELPTLQEQSLLFANCKPHLTPAWHWSCESHKDDASCAWYCYFGNGYQGNYHESFEACAVAVRRLTA